MAHERGYYSALGKIGIGFAAYYVYLDVFDYGVSYSAGENRSAVGIAVCVYGEILYNRAFADKTYKTSRVNDTRYRMSRPVERAAEAVKPVHVLPVFVVAVIEFRFGIADIRSQFIIPVNRVFRTVGFHKFVKPGDVAYFIGYNRNRDLQRVEFIVFTDKRGKRIVSVNGLVRSEFFAYKQRRNVVSKIISVAE